MLLNPRRILMILRPLSLEQAAPYAHNLGIVSEDDTRAGLVEVHNFSFEDSCRAENVRAVPISKPETSGAMTFATFGGLYQNRLFGLAHFEALLKLGILAPSCHTLRHLKGLNGDHVLGPVLLFLGSHFKIFGPPWEKDEPELFAVGIRFDKSEDRFFPLALNSRALESDVSRARTLALIC